MQVKHQRFETHPTQPVSASGWAEAENLMRPPQLPSRQQWILYCEKITLLEPLFNFNTQLKALKELIGSLLWEHLLGWVPCCERNSFVMSLFCLPTPIKQECGGEFTCLERLALQYTNYLCKCMSSVVDKINKPFYPPDEAWQVVKAIAKITTNVFIDTTNRVWFSIRERKCLSPLNLCKLQHTYLRYLA